MNFVNPPEESPQFVTHKTFFSQVLNHEIGYNIYIPEGYEGYSGRYPVVYHIHGWSGNESSEIWPLKKIYTNRKVITVFINAVSSEENYLDALLQIETIIIKELIPYIDGKYKTDTASENRMLSGFSMGGNMAFYYAVKYPEIFGSVTAYAGTYHHLYHKDYRTVGVSEDKVMNLYEEMIREKWDLEENNILFIVRQNADKIRDKLNISIYIGTDDILFCDNELLHLYLNSLNISHEYRKLQGIDHNLEKIVQYD